MLFIDSPSVPDLDFAENESLLTILALSLNPGKFNNSVDILELVKNNL
jgi:hypothetical protein